MVYLDKTSIPVENEMLREVATISCNNDSELGQKIGEAYEKVGKDGVVLMGPVRWYRSALPIAIRRPGLRQDGQVGRSDGAQPSQPR